MVLPIQVSIFWLNAKADCEVVSTSSNSIFIVLMLI